MSANELPDLDADLVDLLAPEGAPTEEAVDYYDGSDEWRQQAPWEPDDATAADWVARRAKRAQVQVDSLVEQRDRLVAQADAWLDRERRRHDRTLKWAEDVLGRWLAREIAADTSKKPRKSRDLPSGVRVKQTGGRPKVVLTDLEAFVAWAAENEEGLLRRPDPEPNKQALAKLAERDGDLVTPDGLVVPGVVSERSPDSYSLDLGGDR